MGFPYTRLIHVNSKDVKERSVVSHHNYKIDLDGKLEVRAPHSN